jgi:hypothetical protein
MSHRKIKDKAVLLGFTAEGKCVYSEIILLAEYWDGQHVWDDASSIKKLRLQTVKGFLFDSSGNLLQEFESSFDPGTGQFKKGWSRHADGSFIEH